MDDLISRQEAIEAMSESLKRVFPEHRQIAKKCLNALPSAQPEYRLDEWCTDCKEYDTEKHCCPRFNQVIRTTLNEMKSERKKGKWIHGKCSNCGEHAPFWAMASTYYKSNFCPNCGAKMRGEQDE